MVSLVPNLVLSRMGKCFAANNVVLNLDKRNIIKFATNNLSHCALSLAYKEQYIEKTVKKLLGLRSDNHLNWKCFLI